MSSRPSHSCRCSASRGLSESSRLLVPNWTGMTASCADVAVQRDACPHEVVIGEQARWIETRGVPLRLRGQTRFGPILTGDIEGKKNGPATCTGSFMRPRHPPKRNPHPIGYQCTLEAGPTPVTINAILILTSDGNPHILVSMVSGRAFTRL
jgi:hypothetical protein